MQGQTNNVGRGPLGVPTNSPINDPGTSALIQNRPNVPVGTAPTPKHGERKPTGRLGGNREQGTDRFPLLQMGARGKDVQRLQRLLNLHLEEDDQLALNGNFDQSTRDAVLDFQKKENLKRDGVVGRDTWFSLVSAGTQEQSWKGKPPEPPPRVVATPSTTETKKTVEQWTLKERFEYVLQHCGPYLGPDLRAQFTALLTPVNLGIMVGSLVVWAAGHFFGVSEVVDAFLFGFGLFFLGRAAIDVARLLKNVIEITCAASTEKELEDAAKDLAEAIAIIGVMTFFALLAKVGRAIGNKLKAARAAGETGAKPPAETEPQAAPKSEPAAEGKSSAQPEGKATADSAEQSGTYRDKNGKLRNQDGTFASEAKDPNTVHNRASEYPHGNSPKVRQEVIKANTNADGQVIDPETGEVIPDDQVTIEHQKPVVEHWNEEGYNQTPQQRNEWYNDSDNLTVKPKSTNSSEGAKLGQTYRQDTGPDYKP